VNFAIAYQQKALAEYEQAVLWYAEKKFDVAKNVEAPINERIALLRKDPTRYKRTYKQFYEVALNQYPYSIVYFINEAGRQVVIFQFAIIEEIQKRSTGKQNNSASLVL
jgi:plasmid stabilization system protein ParE